MAPTNERLVIMFDELRKMGLVQTQRELAEKLRTSASSVSACLKGTANCSTSYLMRVDDAFGNPFNRKWIASGDGCVLAEQQPETNVVDGHHNNTASGNATIISGSGDAIEIAMLRQQCEQLTHDNERLQSELKRANENIERLQTAIINALNK